MTKQQLQATLYYDGESGEAYYVLPSGWEGKYILVNESPVGLSVTYINDDQLNHVEEQL